MMHVSMAQMKKRLIPLPSPDEQRHIARRLRDADELLNSLRSEREARRKQFSYYRDKLLEFPEKVTA
jgi:type I restriction enzyme S subunit